MWSNTRPGSEVAGMLRWSMPAGRVVGVRIYAHWSLLATLVLIAA